MTGELPAWRSASGMALLGVALLAVLELILLGFVVAAQRDSTHIIDISGAQRMRTQEIAVLALAAATGHAEAGWQVELSNAIHRTHEIRVLLSKRSLTRVGDYGKDGLTPTGRLAESYLRAAARIVRDPHDAAALAVIRRDRVPLATAFNNSVHVREARFQHQGDFTVAAIAAALAALLGGVFSAWYYVLLPAERRTREAITALVDSRRQFSSLFYNNPDAIAVYDLEGRVVRGNAAAAELLQYTAETTAGRHFEEHIAPEEYAAAEDVFQQVLQGGTAAFETVFIGSDGRRIEVAVNLFPNIVGGAVAGVFGVARDMRALKIAEASFQEQSNRIGALYKVAAGGARSWKHQIGDALSLACARLDYATGFVAEIADDTATIVVGADAYATGLMLPLGGAVACNAGATSAEPFLVCVARKFFPGDAAAQASFVAENISVPVEISGQTFGALCLVGSKHSRAALSQPDSDFLALVSALVGSSVERGRQEKKLDAMAFYDALTGLPNRVLLHDRLAETIQAARRIRAPFALHYIDLDGFKLVNDRFGHAVGDSVLRIAAKRMQGVLRGTDTVARIGGDEFVILQPVAVDRASAKDVGDRVLAEIARPFVVDGIAHQLGASIGISIYPDDGEDAETLLLQADRALYNAKGNGRNQLQFVA